MSYPDKTGADSTPLDDLPRTPPRSEPRTLPRSRDIAVSKLIDRWARMTEPEAEALMDAIEAEAAHPTDASTEHPYEIEGGWGGERHDLEVADEADTAASTDALRAVLREHTPTLYPDSTHGSQLVCSCGHTDHMAGWWAHIKIEVIEPALAATPPSAHPATPTWKQPRADEPGGRKNPTYETECESCGTRLRITNNYSPIGDFLDQSVEAAHPATPPHDCVAAEAEIVRLTAERDAIADDEQAAFEELEAAHPATEGLDAALNRMLAHYENDYPPGEWQQTKALIRDAIDRLSSPEGQK